MRQHGLWAVLGLGLFLVAGCAAPPVRVPDNARLIFLGRPNPSNWQLSYNEPGELYLFDEDEGRVVLVSPTQGTHLTLENIPAGHQLRVYFVPAPTTRPG